MVLDPHSYLMSHLFRTLPITTNRSDVAPIQIVSYRTREFLRSKGGTEFVGNAFLGSVPQSALLSMMIDHIRKFSNQQGRSIDEVKNEQSKERGPTEITIGR